MQHRGVVSPRGLIFFCIASLLVLGLFVVPVIAQDTGAGPPAGTPARGTNPDNPAGNPDLITIPAEGCRVAEGASVTLKDDEGETQARFIDGQQGIEISATDTQIRIEGPNDTPSLGDHATFPDPGDTSFSTNGNYTVVTTTGITCQGVGAAGQARTDQTSDPIAGQTVFLEDNNGDDTVDVIGPIAVAGCTVDPSATIVVEDADGIQAELVNGQNATIRGTPQAITIQITNAADFETLTPSTGKVVSSTGIVCGDTGGNVANGGDTNAAASQYTEGEVLKKTIPHKKILVDTGGPSLLMVGGAIVAVGLVGLGIFLLRRT